MKTSPVGSGRKRMNWRTGWIVTQTSHSRGMTSSPRGMWLYWRSHCQDGHPVGGQWAGQPSPPTQNYPVQHVSGAIVEKPRSNHSVRSKHSANTVQRQRYEILSSPNAFLKPLFHICDKTHLSAFGETVVVESHQGCPVEPKCARAQLRAGHTWPGCCVLTEPKPSTSANTGSADRVTCCVSRENLIAH